MKKYRILWLSLLRPHKWVRHGQFYLICCRKQNKHMKITKITKRIKHLPPIDELHIYIWYSCNCLFPCNNRMRSILMTYYGKRPGNSHLRAATARVNINLKGRFCYQRGIESMIAHVKRVSVTQKHTLRTQGTREANDNSNE